MDFFGPLEYVFKKRSWPRAELDDVGLAMQTWRGDGHYDGLDGELLHSYIYRTPLAAPKSKKTKTPVRWKSWAVVKIARLLHARRCTRFASSSSSTSRVRLQSHHMS